MEAQNGAAKTPRLRSPNYPALNLQKSLELAGKLFDVHRRHPIPLAVAAKDWGFVPESNYVAQRLAAIAAYGLVEIEGVKDTRKLTISELASNIFIDKRPGSTERAVCIKRAALQPDIFRKLYDAYPEELPADHLLEYELEKDHKFNPNSIRNFINILKATFDFAKVYESDILEAESLPDQEEKMIAASDKIPVKEGTTIRIPAIIPLPDEREVANYPIGQGLKARILVSGKTPLTLRAIEKLVALLELNKEDLPEGGDGENLPS